MEYMKCTLEKVRTNDKVYYNASQKISKDSHLCRLRSNIRCDGE